MNDGGVRYILHIQAVGKLSLTYLSQLFVSREVFPKQPLLVYKMNDSALWQFLLKQPGSADWSGVKTTYTLFYTSLNQDSLISSVYFYMDKS